MDELDGLEARLDAAMRSNDLDMLDDIRRLALDIVDDELSGDEDSLRAASLAADCIDARIQIIVDETPDRIERLKRRALVRLEGQIKLHKASAQKHESTGGIALAKSNKRPRAGKSEPVFNSPTPPPGEPVPMTRPKRPLGNYY